MKNKKIKNNLPLKELTITASHHDSIPVLLNFTNELDGLIMSSVAPSIITDVKVNQFNYKASFKLNTDDTSPDISNIETACCEKFGEDYCSCYCDNFYKVKEGCYTVLELTMFNDDGISKAHDSIRNICDNLTDGSSDSIFNLYTIWYDDKMEFIHAHVLLLSMDESTLVDAKQNFGNALDEHIQDVDIYDVVPSTNEIECLQSFRSPCHKE